MSPPATQQSVTGKVLTAS